VSAEITFQPFQRHFFSLVQSETLRRLNLNEATLPASRSDSTLFSSIQHSGGTAKNLMSWQYFPLVAAANSMAF